VEAPEKLPELALKGIEEFNRGEFYECHEYLEEAWMEEPRRVRFLYQGILQVGVGFYHQQNGNWRGATGLLRNGTQRLKEFEPETLGVDVARLVRAMPRGARRTRARAGTRARQVSDPQSGVRLGSPRARGAFCSRAPPKTSSCSFPLYRSHAGGEFAHRTALDQAAWSSRVILGVDLHLLLGECHEQLEVVTRNLVQFGPADHDLRQLVRVVDVVVERHCPLLARYRRHVTDVAPDVTSERPAEKDYM
jgi:hypothetical protein